MTDPENTRSDAVFSAVGHRSLALGHRPSCLSHSYRYTEGRVMRSTPAGDSRQPPARARPAGLRFGREPGILERAGRYHGRAPVRSRIVESRRATAMADDPRARGD